MYTYTHIYTHIHLEMERERDLRNLLTQLWGWQVQNLQCRDLPGGPMVKTLLLPLQGVWVSSTVRELRSHMPADVAK